MRQIIDERFLSQLELFSLAIKDNVAGLFGGSHQSKKYGTSCEFADYREYVEGDDISKIDWNIYGRFEQLYLKLYLDEKQMYTKIYIDASRSMSFFNKDEYALRLAASLAYLSVSEMDRVSVYLVKGKSVVPLFEKIIGREKFFENVSKLNSVTFDGETFMSEAILRSDVGYGNGKSIIISDFLTDNDYLSAIDFLRDKHRNVLCIQLLAPEELNPTARGKNILYDSEDSNKYFKGNISRDVLLAYHKALDFLEENLTNYCASREADYALYDTSISLRELFMDRLFNKGVIR